MPAPEVIDLTGPSVMVHPRSLTPTDTKPPTRAPNTETNKKAPYTGKRKKNSASSASDHSQNWSTAVTNTKNNSEERGESSQGIRQGGRKREEDHATDENPQRLLQHDRIHVSKNESRQERPPSPKPFTNGELGKTQDFFFLDITPASLPPTLGNLPPPRLGTPPPSGRHESKLLLPAHVSVFGSTPVEILPPAESDEEGDTDYIKYLDYGGERKEFLRYFEEPEDESVKLSRTVCKNCGAERDHKTADCRVLICLTCGVRDEHVTKSCPVSKVCFTCHMKGHINANCPNRDTARHKEHDAYRRCERCFSGLHQTSECPTWWRIYEYVTDEGKEQILTERRPKRDLQLGKGGEGYIAEDEWCYNCGEAGHWGDDCEDRKRHDKPEEPSAFGLYNIASGPFFDADGPVSAPSREQRQLRDWERQNQPSDWGEFAPDNVGRQGKRKRMEQMMKSAQRLEEASDPDNWFESGRGTHTKGVADLRGELRDKDRERTRDKNRDGERDRGDRKGREREGEREKGKGRERREDQGKRDKEKAQDRDRNRNPPSQSVGGRNDIKSISFSRAIGENRHFLPPPSASLPPRPEVAEVAPRPNLLSRLSDRRPDDTSRRIGSDSSTIPLSIKGAGQQKQNRIPDDEQSGRNREKNGRGAHPPDRRDNAGPRYRGGYRR